MTTTEFTASLNPDQAAAFLVVRDALFDQHNAASAESVVTLHQQIDDLTKQLADAKDALTQSQAQVQKAAADAVAAATATGQALQEQAAQAKTAADAAKAASDQAIADLQAQLSAVQSSLDERTTNQDQLVTDAAATIPALLASIASPTTEQQGLIAKTIDILKTAQSPVIQAKLAALGEQEAAAQKILDAAKAQRAALEAQATTV